MSPVSDRPVSDRVIAATASMAAVQDFYFNSRYADRRGQPGVCDFTFGNPQEFPLPGLVQALHRQADLQSASWYDYTTHEADDRKHVVSEQREAVRVYVCGGRIIK